MILFLSADEKRAKIWHFIGRYRPINRPTVGGVSVIAVLYYRTCNIIIEPIDGKTNKIMSNHFCEFKV